MPNVLHTQCAKVVKRGCRLCHKQFWLLFFILQLLFISASENWFVGAILLDEAIDLIVISVPVPLPTQIWFSGRTGMGAILTRHYRGALWLSSNLYWEILGTQGELKITGTNGSLQTQAVQISRAESGDTELSDLPVPDAYTTIPGLNSITQRTALVAAHAHLQLEQDLRNGT